MCGLWFSVGLDANTSAVDIIQHRGPDGTGWKEFSCQLGPVYLGHQRLAIIDLNQHARQPMAYNNDRLWIVFNGEVYNFLELRTELKSMGYSFQTQSDTEVILAAYTQWGEECLHKLYGMFAFVIYDPTNQNVFAARDRFGIKPLYFYKTNNGVAFASEIKQFTTLPGFHAQLNKNRGYDFIIAGLSDHTNETLFKDVQQIRGGECVKFDLTSQLNNKAALPICKWYRLPKPDSLRLSKAEAESQFADIFSDSVRKHLRSDVAIGSCLSGGLDSSSIVCLMSNIFKEQNLYDSIHTISACYDDKSADEREYIEPVVALTNCKSTYVFPNPNDLVTNVEKITWHQCGF